MIGVGPSRTQSRWRARVRAGTVPSVLALLAIALLSGCGATPTPSPAGGQTTGPAGSAATASASPAQSQAAASASPGAAASASASGGGPGDIRIPSDPCALLSTAELQTATGVSFAAGQKTTAGTTVECDWAAGTKTVSLTIGPLDAQAFAAGKSVSQAVPGVGDDAYEFPKPLELHVADVNLEVTAQVSLGGGTDADRAAELAIIKVVLVKLAT